jgi:quercetin dioxygenase-like cupin family protein
MGGGPGELVFENRWVRAYRVRLEPHQHIPMHRLTSRLVVWLTDAHLRDSLSTGKVQEVAQKSGDVAWVPAQRHAGVNLGDAPVSFIAVEIK